MASRLNQERALEIVLAQIEAAPLPSQALVAEVLEHACPRLRACPAQAAMVQRMIETEAWVDVGLQLIGWELPDWSVHNLSCDESAWSCSIGRRGLAINWADVAAFHHESVALAVMGALVQAQLSKTEGAVTSTVVAFARLHAAAARHP